MYNCFVNSPNIYFINILIKKNQRTTDFALVVLLGRAKSKHSALWVEELSEA